MPNPIPQFSLTHGQVLWCLAGGRPVKPPLPHQVRYLRQLGIPFQEAKRGHGRGIPMTYNFYELMELGIAHEGLKRGAAPRDLQPLADKRERVKYRRVYDVAYAEFMQKDPNAFLGNTDERPMFLTDYYVRLRDRFSSHPEKIELAEKLEGEVEARAGDLFEIIGGEEIVVIQLKSLMQRLMRLANVAPYIRAGRK